MRSLEEEFGNGDDGGGPTAHPIEQRDHLRNRGHLHLASANRPDRDANQDANDRDDDSRRGEM